MQGLSALAPSFFINKFGSTTEKPIKTEYVDTAEEGLLRLGKTIKRKGLVRRERPPLHRPLG